jgi:recombination protein RecT
MSKDLQRVQTVGALISQRKNMINALFKNDEDANRFRAIAVSVTSNYKLAQCTDDSLISCVMGIGQLRLSIDPNLGHAYIVPYNVRDKDDKSIIKYTVAQLQIGYKGFIQLMYRAGWFIEAFEVFECDAFEAHFDNNSMSIRYDFSPNFGQREDDSTSWVFDNLKGILVVAKDNQGNKATNFVTKKLIEKIRMKSDNQKNPKAPTDIWATWYVEMAKKTAIKKTAKLLAIGDEKVALVIKADDLNEVGQVINYEKTFENGVIVEDDLKKITPSTSINDALQDGEEITV